MRTSAAPPLVILALALGWARGHSPTDELPRVPCHARAWVRAPNLTPGKIIQGDVKVKFDGSCDEVSSCSLGLRFAERSWVKTPREGAVLPVRPADDIRLMFSPDDSRNYSIYDEMDSNRWSFGSGANRSALDQYENDMKNPALWVVHEEERIGFEARYELANGTTKPHHEIIKTFTILVPSTNYPPAFDRRFSGGLMNGVNVNVAGGEHIYQYFVDVTFVNGTYREIEAGYTSFHTVTLTEHGHAPVSVNVTAIRDQVPCKQRKQGADDAAPRDEFILEVTFPDGMDFEQGSTNNITIVSHQRGPGTQRASSVEAIVLGVQQKNHWAAKHAADTEAAEALLLYSGMRHRDELLPTLDNSDILHDWRSGLQAAKPNFAQEFTPQNHTTEPVTAQFVVPARAYLPFERYYQTSEIEMSILLQVRNVSEEASNEDTVLGDEEEYHWTPSEYEQEPVFRRDGEMLRATIPISVHRKPEQLAVAVSNTVHYLSPEARAPSFVDPSMLPQLLRMTPEERETLAPLCQPQFISKFNEEVMTDRYFTSRGRAPQALYYVGNTWLRKVLARQGVDNAAQQDGVSVVQA